MLSSDSMQKLDCISYKLYVLPYGFVLSKNCVEDAAFSFDQWEYFQVNRLGPLWLKQDSAEEKKFIVEDIFEEKIVNFGDPLPVEYREFKSSQNTSGENCPSMMWVVKVLLVFIGDVNCFANWKIEKWSDIQLKTKVKNTNTFSKSNINPSLTLRYHLKVIHIIP